jgi:hypothetical protein
VVVVLTGWACWRLGAVPAFRGGAAVWWVTVPSPEGESQACGRAQRVTRRAAEGRADEVGLTERARPRHSPRLPGEGAVSPQGTNSAVQRRFGGADTGARARRGGFERAGGAAAPY